MAIGLEQILFQEALSYIGSILNTQVGYQDVWVHRFERDFTELVAKAESADVTKAEQEAAVRQIEALAKGLPALASGLRDAIKGFQGGDPFTGSAAVMDICATLAETIGGMIGGAGGPPGALVGAVFSIVSMILKMFVPAQESLTRQMESLIRGIDAEAQVRDLVSAQGSVRAFITSVSGNDDIKWTLSEYQSMLNPIDGNAIKAIRGAATWLSLTKNQDLSLWGEVLASQCQSYTLLKHGLTYATAALHDDPHVKTNELAKLIALWTSNDSDQLTFVRQIKAVARSRGVVWHVGTRSNRGDYPDAGSLYVRDTSGGAWTDLGERQRLVAISSITTKVDGKDAKAVEPRPYLAVFAVEQESSAIPPRQRPGFAYRNRRNGSSRVLVGRWPLDRNNGWKNIENLEGCYDLCAVPSARAHEVLVYAANGTQIDRYILHSGAPSGPGGLRLLPMSSGPSIRPNPGHTVDSVRVVERPRAAGGSDRMRVDDVATIVYGGCHKGNDRLLWMHLLDDKGQTIKVGGFKAAIPDFVGMTVDSRFLWVFTRRGIACTSHAEARYCITQGTPTPKWAGYGLPVELGGNWETEGRFDGLLDLAACEDGTLVAVIADQREPRIYQATPKVTFEDGPPTIEISGEATNDYGQTVATNGWVPSDGEAWRVYKQPIFCWQLVNELERTLQQAVLAKPFSRLTGA